MKNILLSTLAISLFLFSCGSSDKSKSETTEKVETTETAIAYNDKMIDIQSEVDQELVNLLDVIELGVYEDMTYAHGNALATIADAKEEVEDMDDFDGKDNFKEEMLKLLDMYEEIVSGEIAEIIELSANFDLLTDEELTRYDELYAEALDKYDTSFSDFTDFQNEFAKKWDFDLEAN